MVAAIDGSQTGDIKTTEWAIKGMEFPFSSPLLDGTRLYQIDGGSTLKAFDAATGKLLWEQRLGRLQKAPPVLADGKIYVGTENGHFFIVRPHADRAEVLSDVQLPLSTDSFGGSEGTPEQIQAGAAISRGRVFFVSSDAVYAIGPKTPKAPTGVAVDEPAVKGEGAPAYVQVTPTEMVLAPGQTVKMRARLFDDKGRFIRDEPAASWTLEGLKGTIDGGTLVVSSDPAGQAGLVKATVGGMTGEARARVAHPLPWRESFDSFEDKTVPPGWVNAEAGRLSVVTLDGQKVLQKAR